MSPDHYTAKPPSGANTIEDSIRGAYASAGRAEHLLDLIWGDLTGNGSCSDSAGAPNPCGLVYEAENLASRISDIANRLEDVRSRITSPKLAQVQGVATSAALRNARDY